MSTKVFPAYAGMNRRIDSIYPSEAGVPRIRGDEPLVNGNWEIVEVCSPHTRG